MKYTWLFPNNRKYVGTLDLSGDDKLLILDIDKNSYIDKQDIFPNEIDAINNLTVVKDETVKLLELLNIQEVTTLTECGEKYNIVYKFNSMLKGINLYPHKRKFIKKVSADLYNFYSNGNNVTQTLKGTNVLEIYNGKFTNTSLIKLFKTSSSHNLFFNIELNEDISLRELYSILMKLTMLFSLIANNSVNMGNIYLEDSCGHKNIELTLFPPFDKYINIHQYKYINILDFDNSEDLDLFKKIIQSWNDVYEDIFVLLESYFLDKNNGVEERLLSFVYLSCLERIFILRHEQNKSPKDNSLQIDRCKVQNPFRYELQKLLNKYKKILDLSLVNKIIKYQPKNNGTYDINEVNMQTLSDLLVYQRNKVAHHDYKKKINTNDENEEFHFQINICKLTKKLILIYFLERLSLKPVEIEKVMKNIDGNTFLIRNFYDRLFKN